MAAIGIGIVGCGGNGLNHLEVWHSMDGAKIIGVCDIDEARAKERADLIGVKAFTSVEDLVKEPGVDAVDVVTSASHLGPVVVAAEAGKPVIVENPFANTSKDADAMIAAAEKTGVPLMYGQTHRFYSMNLKAKELIESGELGDPISITWTYFAHGDPTQERWHRWKANGGGFLTYEGTHLIDQLKWVMGSEVKTAYAVGSGRYVLAGDAEDNVLVGLGFESGAFGTIHHGTSTPGARFSGWRSVGTKGMLDVQSPDRLQKSNGEQWEDVPFPYKGDPKTQLLTRTRDTVNYNGFRTEFTEFLDSIKEGRQPSCSGYDGRASTAVAEAVLESAETGQPVHL